MNPEQLAMALELLQEIAIRLATIEQCVQKLTEDKDSH